MLARLEYAQCARYILDGGRGQWRMRSGSAAVCSAYAQSRALIRLANSPARGDAREWGGRIEKRVHLTVCEHCMLWFGSQRTCSRQPPPKPPIQLEVYTVFHSGQRTKRALLFPSFIEGRRGSGGVTRIFGPRKSGNRHHTAPRKTQTLYVFMTPRCRRTVSVDSGCWPCLLACLTASSLCVSVCERCSS